MAVGETCKIIISTVMTSQLFGLYDLHDPLIMESDSLQVGCKKGDRTVGWKYAGRITVELWLSV